MKFTLEGTPLSIAYHTDLRLEAECGIYDIHYRHADRLKQLFDQHPFFEHMTVEPIIYGHRIVTVKVKWSAHWGDPAEEIATIEDRVNEVLDQLADESMGYHAIKA